jgi:hypothetical protein
MSAKLTGLHAQLLATREPGWSAAARAAAETAFRAYAREIVAGLPFPHSLVRVEWRELATTTTPPVVHIVPAEDILLGRLRRLRGDALCKERRRFAGRLGQLVPVEEGASCYTCLEIAERLSIVEYQAP